MLYTRILVKTVLIDFPNVNTTGPFLKIENNHWLTLKDQFYVNISDISNITTQYL